MSEFRQRDANPDRKILNRCCHVRWLQIRSGCSDQGCLSWEIEADDVEVPGDIQSIVLYTRGGLPLRIGDVADVEEGRELWMFIPMALTVLLGAMIFSVTFVPAGVGIFLRGKISEKETILIRWSKAIYLPLLNLSLR